MPNSNDLPRKIIIFFIIVILIKLWLVGAHDIIAKLRPHDDSLFITLAQNILNGEWLGKYNNKTLIKGVGYPLFIAASHYLGIPLLSAQQYLYILACILAIFAIRPIVKNILYLIPVFCLLLFNPFSFNYPVVGAVQRESIYFSYSLMSFASMIGLWVYSTKSINLSVLWSIILSISFTLLWFTREEGIWFVPGLVLFGLIYVFPWRWNPGLNTTLRVLLYSLPILCVMLAHSGISALNKHYYQVSIVNELKSKEFVAALGGLMNIKPDKHTPQTPVSRDVLDKALKISPALQELEPYITAKNVWLPSFFVWKLLSSARQAGYYDDPGDASRTLHLYKRIGEEIKLACELKTISCYDRKATLRPPWLAVYNKQVIPTFSDLAYHAVSFDRLNTDSSKYSTKADSNLMYVFNYVTGENTFRNSIYLKPNQPEYFKNITRFKERVLARIGRAYHYIVPVLFVAALFIHIRLLVSDRFSRALRFKPLFGMILLGGIISILSLLTFVEITLWDTPRPLHVIYPIIILYFCFILTPFSKDTNGL